MAKGKAGLSSSGASMSKYDVEVEARLKALEAQAHPDRCNDVTGGGDCAALEAKVDKLIQILHHHMDFEI